MNANPPGSLDASGWRHDGSVLPACQPCAHPEPDWVRWSRLVSGCGGEWETWGRAIFSARRSLRRVVLAFSAVFAASLRERLRHRADLLGSMLQLAVFLWIIGKLWEAVAAGEGSVGEFTVPQLVAYLLVAELVAMGPAPVHQRVAGEVRSGAFVTTLLRPTSHATWQLARASGEAAVRAVALLGAGLVTLALTCGIPELDWRGVVIGLVLLVPAALALELIVRVLIGLCAFWIEEPGPFYWIWQKLAFVLGGLFMPLDFYPDWLRRACELLPFSALLFGPARTVVAFEPATAVRAALSLAAWLMLAVAALVALEAAGRRRVFTQGG